MIRLTDVEIKAAIKIPTNLPLSFEACGIDFERVAQAQLESDEAEIRKIFEEIDNLIIGIDGCKFEERLDGDKGCIVLDMNENQWQALKERLLK